MSNFETPLKKFQKNYLVDTIAWSTKKKNVLFDNKMKLKKKEKKNNIRNNQIDLNLFKKNI